jgi:hypothetical protein
MNSNKKIQQTWQSLLLPIVLMLAGAILLGADRLGTISLARVTDFWPMAIILVGLAELIPSEDTQRRARND